MVVACLSSLHQVALPLILIARISSTAHHSYLKDCKKKKAQIKVSKIEATNKQKGNHPDEHRTSSRPGDFKNAFPIGTLDFCCFGFERGSHKSIQGGLYPPETWRFTQLPQGNLHPSSKPIAWSNIYSSVCSLSRHNIIKGHAWLVEEASSVYRAISVLKWRKEYIALLVVCFASFICPLSL